MSYFKNVPFVPYQFGTLSQYTWHQHLGSYVSLIDRLKDNVSFYQKHTILDGDRPDNLSYKLYGTPEYHWTFFLMNDKLRERGWPITFQKVDELVKSEQSNTVLTTQDDLTGIFKIGSTVSGTSSGASGKIIQRRLDLGQLIIDGLHSFYSTEDIQTTESGNVNSVTLVSATYQYNSIHHYEDSDGTIVDINPYSDPSILLTPVTYYDYYFTQNNDLKDIVVIKPNVINSVFEQFNEEMKSSIYG